MTAALPVDDRSLAVQRLAGLPDGGTVVPAVAAATGPTAQGARAADGWRR